jgi:hypothetical protein
MFRSSLGRRHNYLPGFDIHSPVQKHRMALLFQLCGIIDRCDYQFNGYSYAQPLLQLGRFEAHRSR